jgi:hypothetical protein
MHLLAEARLQRAADQVVQLVTALVVQIRAAAALLDVAGDHQRAFLMRDELRAVPRIPGVGGWPRSNGRT